MKWADPISFLAMGGYGVYVWGSMAATLIAVLAECILLKHRRKTALATIQNTHAPDDTTDSA